MPIWGLAAILARVATQRHGAGSKPLFLGEADHQVPPHKRFLEKESVSDRLVGNDDQPAPVFLVGHLSYVAEREIALDGVCRLL